jgi:hypothetical protein
MADKGSIKIAEQILGRIHEIQELNVPVNYFWLKKAGRLGARVLDNI